MGKKLKKSKKSKQEIGKMAKEKGKRIEREAVKFLKSIGFDAYRGMQYKGGQDSPDVYCKDLPNVHFEVKGDAKMDLGTKLMRNAKSQADRDSQGGPCVVLWKPPRKCWRVTTSITTKKSHFASCTFCLLPDIVFLLRDMNDEPSSRS
jgi:Holliday junction resolvase